LHLHITVAWPWKFDGNITNFHEHENTVMYKLKTTKHVHVSSSFLDRFFYNTCTLLCKVTRPVNEHKNFCNQLKGVQIQEVTTKLNDGAKSFWILDIECLLSPCCQPQFWDSSYIFSISVHLCYPISFLLLLASMLLPNSNTSSTDPHNHFL